MHRVEKCNYTLTMDFMNYQVFLCVCVNLSSIFVALWRIFPELFTARRSRLQILI